ncbi:MAG: trypsin-like peptidase domain-containing protein [Leptolyngbyaceae bacterium]|nr:trypsin-like peptidase domain-containing protein [Leptolyngbyaceae bacterium]
MYRYFVSTALASCVAAIAIAPVVERAIAQSQPQDINTRLSEYVKPSILRIFDGCQGEFTVNGTYYVRQPVSVLNSGSGFFIHPDGYIATNAHVVSHTENEHQTCEEQLLEKGISIFREINANVAEGDRLSEEQIKEGSRLDNVSPINMVLLPSGDAFAFDIKSFGKPISNTSDSNGKDVAIIKIQVSNAPSLLLASDDSVNLQEEVIAFGYPAVADFNESTLESKLQVTVNDGRVSAIGKETGAGVDVLQINADISAGNSGGPVINHQGEVIGIVAFKTLMAAEQSGPGFAIPTNTIREYLGPAGVANEEGEVNVLYRKGLDYYWNGDYRRATLTFQKIRNMFPEHSEIDRLIQDSEANKPSAAANILFIGGGFVGVLAAIGAGAYFLMKKKFNQGFGKPTSTPYTATRSGLGDRPYSSPDTTPQNGNGNIPAPTGVYSPATTMSAAPQATVMTLHPYIELKNPQGEVLELTLERDTHQFGRDRAWSDIAVPENGWTVISRCHATIQREGSEYRIYDGDRSTGSSNGLFINGKRITPKDGYLLKDGDQLKIGQDQRNQVTLTYFKPVV